MLYNLLKYSTRVLFAIFYRVKVEGSVNIPEDQGYMICANHIHMFDPVLITINHKRKISFMVKKELIETPILGKMLLNCGAFPVDRTKGDLGAIKTAIDVLNHKKVLSIFPEGTRHKDGKFRDIKKGAALIAIKTKSTVIPMRIIGNYKLFSKLTLRIGEPISPEGYNKDEFTEKLKKAIEELA